jgi:hypothetical protein
MLPYKHYAAQEIEQVLLKQEEPTAPLPECVAEESTLQRWKREYLGVLTALVFRLSSLANAAINLLSDARPLHRLYGVLDFLEPPPPNFSRLAWAFFLSQAYQLHIG